MITDAQYAELQQDALERRYRHAHHLRDRRTLTCLKDHMPKLTTTRISEIAKKNPKAKEVAVTNFLGSLEGSTQSDALANLDQDARSYKWNAPTKNAIRTGILEHFKR